MDIRNFCIIAHIDHGKSTLADRFLEITGTVDKRVMRSQYLDQMDLERERGITIKLAPVRMAYRAQIVADQNADQRGLLYEELTYRVRGAIFRVYNALGPGFKEGVYQRALENEFVKDGLSFEREKTLNVSYNGATIGIDRPDFIVEEKIIIEIKALPFIGKLEKKQTWYYLKGSPYRLALLVNFGGKEVFIERIVYDEARDNIREDLRCDPRTSAYILNLIDTPGHVDFSYEVSRSLAAVEGAILLVDATQGVQAQTLANFELARSLGLAIIPAVNKIDLPQALPDDVAEELAHLVGTDAAQVYHVSGKTGKGVAELLEAVVAHVPPPLGDTNASLRALIFDSIFDPYRGVVAFVRVVDGSVRAGDRLSFLGTRATSECLEVGIFSPKLKRADVLNAGEIGYIVTGLKSIQGARVGDTVTSYKLQATSYKLEALPGYREVTPMVFAGVYPAQTQDAGKLRDALEKLKLNDAALALEPERSDVFGFGFRAGFLGLLHLDIVRERVRREYGISVIVAVPSVAYHVVSGDAITTVKSALELPDPSSRPRIEEPILSVSFVTPASYVGAVMQLAQSHRGVYRTTEHPTEARVILRYDIPLAAMLTDFYDQLKSVSQGYASYSYEFFAYQPCNVVRLDVLVGGDMMEELASIVYTEEAQARGRSIVERLKETLPRQMFDVKIQAAIGGKIVASERLPPLRKDVLKGMSGGDYSRKRKLLEQQKRGKKKMKDVGRMTIPPEAFMALLKR